MSSFSHWWRLFAVLILVFALGGCPESSPPMGPGPDTGTSSDDATPEVDADSTGASDGTVSTDGTESSPDIPPVDEDSPVENLPDPGSANLLIEKSGEGRIRITGLGEPLSCDKDCEELTLEPAGDPITLLADPACGWSFDGWTGSCSGNGPQVLVVDTDLHCIATFSPAGDTETLQAEGTGMVFEHSAQWGWHATQLTMGEGSTVWPLVPRTLWSMDLWDAGEIVLHVSGEDSHGQTCHVVETGPDRALEFNWLDVTSAESDILDVQVLARATTGDPLLRFSASVVPTEDSSHARGVGRFNLPVVEFKSLTNGEDAELYLPACGGLQFTNPGVSARTSNQGNAVPGQPIDFQYPDVYNMRFSALADTAQEMAVILSTEDSAERRFEIKQFLAWGTDNEDIRLSLGRLPEDPTVQRALDIPGESTLTTLPCTNPEACWHDAASWFRDKVDAEGYLTRPILENVTAPLQAALLQDTSIVVGHNLEDTLNTTPDFASYLSYFQSMSNWLGLSPSQIITTWYDWHDNVFDIHLPQHLPPQAGYVAQVALARADGFHVLPYTTPSAWDYTLPTYTSLGVATEWGIYARDGSTHDYEHVIGHPQHAVDFAVPSLALEFVQAHYSEFFTNHQISGLYLDFFPRPARCHATNHGHEIGGGASFANGARDYLSLVQDQAILKTGTSLIVAEALGDYLVDYMALGNCYRTDGGLVPVDTDLLGHIPLFDAVFRDRVQMASLAIADMPGAHTYNVIRELDATTVPGAIENLRRTVTLEMGWSFSMGHLLVLMHRPIPEPSTGNTLLLQDPDFGSLMTLYKNLTTIRARPDVKEIVVKGRLAVPPETLDEMPPLLANPSKIPNRILPELAKAIPAVFTQAYTNEKGDLAITIFNWTSTHQPLSLLVHPDRYGMEVSPGTELLSEVWKVTLHSNSGAQILTTDLNTQLELLAPSYIAVPSAEPLVLLYEKIVPDDS